LSAVSVAEEFRGTSVAVGAQNTYWVQRGGIPANYLPICIKQLGAPMCWLAIPSASFIWRNRSWRAAEGGAVLASGMIPVVCVGETFAEHESGATKEVLEVQLRPRFDGITVAPGSPSYSGV